MNFQKVNAHLESWILSQKPQKNMSAFFDYDDIWRGLNYFQHCTYIKKILAAVKLKTLPKPQML